MVGICSHSRKIECSSRSFSAFALPLMCCVALLISYVGFTSCHLLNAKVSILRSSKEEEMLQNMGLYCRYGILEEIMSSSLQDKRIWMTTRSLAGLALVFGFVSSVYIFFLILYPDKATKISTLKKCLPVILVSLLQALSMSIFSSPICTNSISQKFEGDVFNDVISIKVHACSPGYGTGLIWSSLTIYIMVCYTMYSSYKIPLKEESNIESSQNYQEQEDSPKRSKHRKPNPALINLVIDVDPDTSYKSTCDQDEEQRNTPLCIVTNVEHDNLSKHKPLSVIGKEGQTEIVLDSDALNKSHLVSQFAATVNQKMDTIQVFILPNLLLSCTPIQNIATEDTEWNASQDIKGVHHSLSVDDDYMSDITTSTQARRAKYRLHHLNHLQNNGNHEENTENLGIAPEHIYAYQNRLHLRYTFSDTDESSSHRGYPEVLRKYPVDYGQLHDEEKSEEEGEEDRMGFDEGKSDDETRRKRKMWIQQLQSSFQKHEAEKRLLQLHADDSETEGSSYVQSSFSAQSQDEYESTLNETQVDEMNLDDSSKQHVKNPSSSPSCVIRGIAEVNANLAEEKEIDSPVRYKSYMGKNHQQSSLNHLPKNNQPYGNQSSDSSSLIYPPSEDGDRSERVTIISCHDYDGDLDEDSMFARSKSNIFNKRFETEKQHMVLFKKMLRKTRNTQTSSDVNSEDTHEFFV